MRTIAAVALVSLFLAGAAACTEGNPASESDLPALLLEIAPAGGDVDVSVRTSVAVTFSHPIGWGMEAYAALHEGALTGPEIEGVWALSADRTVLTFDPTMPLKPATTYFIHLGGGMMDAHGHHVDLGQHGHGFGGSWATGSMMGASMGMGQGNAHMMGSGWAHPNNGSYGMVFSFTTAT